MADCAWVRVAVRGAQITLCLLLLGWIVWFASENLDWQRFAEADLMLIGAALVLIPVGWVIRAWRYRALVDASQQDGVAGLSLGTSFAAFTLFLAGNAALPIRGGELIRVGYVKSECRDLPAPLLVGAAGAEKVPELIFVGLVGLVWMFARPSSDLLFAMWVAASMIAVIAGLVVSARLLLTGVAAAGVGVQPTDGYLRKVSSAAVTALRSMRFLTSFSTALPIGVATLMSRMFDTAVMLLIAAAFSIHMSVSDTLLIGAALTLGAAVSVLPAHLGVFEASVVAGGLMSGMLESEALLFGLGFHAVVLVSWLFAAGVSVPYLLGRSR